MEVMVFWGEFSSFLLVHERRARGDCVRNVQEWMRGDRGDCVLKVEEWMTPRGENGGDCFLG